MRSRNPMDPAAVSELLAKLVAEVSGASSEGEILTLAARRSARLTQSVRSSFALLDGRDRFQVYALAKGQGFALPVGSAMALENSNVGIAVSQRRLSRATRASGLRDVAVLVADGIVETMAVPVFADDEVIGTLNVGADKDDAWDEETERLFEQLAKTISNCLSLRRDVTRSKHRLAEVEALADALRDLSHFGYALQAALTEDDLFLLTDHFVRDILPQTKRTSVAWVGRRPGVADLVAIDGQKLKEPEPFPLGETGLAECVEQRHMVITDDLRHGPHANPTIVEAGILSAVTVPIISGGRVLGVLNVGAGGIAAFQSRAIELVANAASLLGARFVTLRLWDEREQSARNLARLLDGLQDAVCVVREGVIRYANQPFKELLGYETHDPVGVDLTEVGDFQTLLARREQATQVASEHLISRRDGSSVLATVGRLQVLYDGHECAALVIRDVSAQQEMERQLRLTERLASLGTMSAGIAHEINNPLAFLIGNLSVLEEELAQPVASFDRSSVREIIQECREGSDRIRRIVSDLKANSRAGDASLVAVRVEEVVNAAVRLLGHTVRHNATLKVDISPLPEVMGEPSRLEQIFLNLLNNAAQAMPDRPREENLIRVLGSTDPQGNVVVEVVDTGRGIPAGEMDRIFDPFYTTKRVGEGTGLGLFIAEGIVRNLGGNISVMSEVGEGTTFRIWLPAARMHEQVTRKRSLVPPIRRAETARILVVDDETAMCRTIQRILGSEHDVLTTTSPNEALTILQEDSSFDLVICDVMMPEMSGRRLYLSLAEEHARLAARFIFVTGGAFTDAAEAFLENTSNPVLRKPFGVDQLRRAVDQSLGVANSRC